jgi:hypothetical protein
MGSRLGISLMLVLALARCETFLINTNFYQLHRGISKQEFIDSWQHGSDAKNMTGGRPAASQAFRVGPDFWEVWVYNVYRIAPNGDGVVDHQEYVAFKDDRLEEWGIGTLPLTLRDNPNRVDVHVHP